jgi:hypothetical protein
MLLRVLTLMFEGYPEDRVWLETPDQLADYLADATSFWQRSDINMASIIEVLFAVTNDNERATLVGGIEARLFERNKKKGTILIRVRRSYAPGTLKRAIAMVLRDVIPALQ